VFNAYIYATGRIDDAITRLDSRELLPLPGYRLYKGKQVLVGSTQIDKAIKDRRAAWRKTHPDAKDSQGPFPYQTVVVVRRKGVIAPQTLRVTFADGSKRDVAVTSARSWQRFTFTTPAKAVSAELDPADRVHMDRSELDDSRTIEGNPAAKRRWFGDFVAVLQSLFAFFTFV
jgi:hypothetical protein